MNRAGKRRGLYLLIVGPDGSGKSSLATQVISRLGSNGVETAHIHFHPTIRDATQLFPPAGDPHTQPARAILAATMSIGRRLALYWASSAWGVLSRRRKTILVQERGWIDQIADPTRYRLPPAVAPLVRLVGATLRRPDIVVLCGGDPSIIVARKQELTETEVVRQLSFWKHELERYQRTVVVDSTRLSIEEAVCKILDTVEGMPRRQTDEIRTMPLLPRRLEMVRSQGARSSVRALYRPTSTSGLIAREISLRMPLKTGHISTDYEWKAELLELASRYGVSDPSFAIMRSVGRPRFVIGIERSNQLTIVAKVVEGEDDDLRREAWALREMARDDMTFKVPELLGLETLNQCQFLLTRAITPVARFRQYPLPLVQELCVALGRSRNGEGIVHGDLAPWNMVQSDKVHLLDWEHHREYQPGFDLCYYVTVAGALAGQFSEEEALRVLGNKSPMLASYVRLVGANLRGVHQVVDACLMEVATSNHKAAPFARRILVRR